MNVEVFTIGGGEYVVNVFNAIAAWCGGGGYRSMLQVVMLMGFMYSLCVVAFNLDWRAWLNWFLQATAIYMVLMVPTVTVKVTDRINPNLAPAMVGNVPLGLGIMASFTSQVGDYLTRTAETVFVMPNQLAYSSNGFIYGSKLFEATRQLDILDPVFASNLDAHMKQCVFYDVMLGFKDLGDLAGKQDLWTGIGPGSQARSQPFVTRNGDGTTSQSILTCRDAYNNLTPQWQQVLTASSPQWAGRLFPGMSQANANAKLMADLPATYQAFTHNSDNAFAIMRQHLAINAFMQARDNFNGGTGSASIDSFAATRADLQTHNTYSAIAQGAMKWVPILNIVLTVVFYAMFPVLFPLFLMPKTGVATLKGYATGFFYLAAWGPLYVVLHMILMSKAITAASTIAPGGVTLATFSSIGAVNDETATLAGYLIAAVPFIAAGMARGATAISSQATSFLAPSQNAAEAAAAEATTGNYSYGNASLANATLNTQSRDQWSTAPTFSSGAAVSSFRDGHGVVTSVTAAGNHVINSSGGMSQLPDRPTFSSGTTAEARQLLSQYQAQSTQMSERASSSFTAADTSGRQLFSTMQHSHGSDLTTGRSTSEMMSTSADYTRQLSDRLVKDAGWTRSAADQASQTAVTSAGFAISGDWKKDFGKVLGGKAAVTSVASYNQNGAHNNTQNQTETAEAAVRKGLEILKSESRSTRFQQAHDTFERASANSSDSAVQGLTAQRNASLTDARTFSADAARMNDEGKRYERQLGLSSSQGFTWTSDLSQRWVEFSNRELATSPALAAPGWSPGLVGELTPQQRAVRDQIENRFEQSYLHDMKAGLPPIGPLSGRPVAGPGFSSRRGAERRGEAEMGAVERLGPAVKIADNAGDPSIARIVGGTLSGTDLLMGRVQAAARDVGDFAQGQAADVRSYARGRNEKWAVTTIPLVDGAMNLVGLGTADARPLTKTLGIDIKPGTNISSLRPPMLPAIAATAAQARSIGLPTPTITSGQDRHHHPGSLHPDGAALDWRGNNITTGKGLLWAASTRKTLGPNYDVVFEHDPRNPKNDHLHTEYDPKGRKR